MQVTDFGFVDLTEDRRPVAEQSEGDYGVQDGGQEFVYGIDAAAAGTWTLRILPENTFGFR
ncbi:MAG: hypothetical protein ABEH59_02180 [Halobacteriales archaeon]